MNQRLESLAVNGGQPIRGGKFPPRRLFGLEEKNAANEVFDEAIATGNAFGYGGPREQAYEQEFAQFLGGGMAKAVNSGTSAVLAAVAALELEPGSEVITPPITDPGGVMPVVMMNCVPVPADTDGFSFNMGAEQVQARLTPRTRAIVVAHIMGEPADMPGIMALARDRGLPVIEDCAQAHGTRIAGELVGTFGDISAFSTMSGKHHASGAQGGLVFTRNEKLFWTARRFMDRGKPYGSAETSNLLLGLNLNSNDLAAAIGRVQLRKLPGIVQRRREVAESLRGPIDNLSSVRFGQVLPSAEPTYWFLRMTVDAARLSVSKDAFASALAAEGVPVMVSYGHSPAEHIWFKTRRTYGQSGCPWTCERYKGDPNASYDQPNYRRAVADNFLIAIHEGWGEQEIQDTIRALEKVEAAYLNR